MNWWTNSTCLSFVVAFTFAADCWNSFEVDSVSKSLPFFPSPVCQNHTPCNNFTLSQAKSVCGERFTTNDSTVYNFTGIKSAQCYNVTCHAEVTCNVIQGKPRYHAGIDCYNIFHTYDHGNVVCHCIVYKDKPC